jgi:NAD(P)-dependent dehydrogenase (short-subunit alcohol dehydrogenase family)
VLHYSHSDAGAKSAAEEIQAMGRQAKAIQADFNDVDAVRNLAVEAESFLGQVDVLVNNAGITMNLPFMEVNPEQFDTLFNVNIKAMFFLTQAACKGMIERGKGAVINLTSVHANYALHEHSIYAATKGAIVSFTRTTSVDLAPLGVRMNAIAPGWVVVENHYKAIEDLDISNAAQAIPAGFVGEPRDIGSLAVFLASDAARYIVGQTYMIDGGQASNMYASGDFRERREHKFGRDYVNVTE